MNHCDACEAPIKNRNQPIMRAKHTWFTIGQMALLNHRLWCPLCILMFTVGIYAREQLEAKR